MSGSTPTPVNASLREEFGPFPWWSRDHLRELLVDRGLSPDEIAEAFGAHPKTIHEWARRHGLRGEPTGGPA